MPDRDLDTGLAALYHHGRRTGHLAAAAAVRARADRRRRRLHASGGALGVALLGALSVAIALGQPRGHAGPERPGAPTTPPASTATAAPSHPATTAPAATAPTTSTGAPPSSRPAGPSSVPPVLSGNRQVYFYVLHKGEEVPELLLDVLPGRRVDIDADYGDAGLFVPRPAPSGGGLYQILTAKLRTGGEPLCLAVSNGAGPLKVVTAACDARSKAQLFSIYDEGKDNQGRTMYGVENQSAFLQYDPNGHIGLYAEELGDASLDTTFVLIDRGPQTLPDFD
jgi:hypothetical protein